MHGTLLGLGRPRVVALSSLLSIAVGLLLAWALRGQGLLAVAAFGAGAAGSSLLAKAAWLHGRVLQRVQFGEMLAAALLLLALGLEMQHGRWAEAFGPGLLPCVAALGASSLAILALGASWDWFFSRRKERDSLVSIVLQRLRRPA
jgi:hypothetical protein